MNNEKMFPILKTKSEYIPWSIVAIHEKQALENHGQTLEKLAERGGLSWIELYFVLTDSKYIYNSMTDLEAKEKVLALIPNQEWIVPVSWEACGFIKVQAQTAEEACQKVHDNPDYYPLPKVSEYVDSSFNISGDIDECITMSEMYTKDYHSGKLQEDF